MGPSPPTALFAPLRRLEVFPSELAAQRAAVGQAAAAVCCTTFEGIFRTLEAAAPQRWLSSSQVLLGLRGLSEHGDLRRLAAQEGSLRELRQAGITAAGLAAAWQRQPAAERPALEAELRPLAALLEPYEAWVASHAKDYAGDAAERPRAAILRWLQGDGPQRWKQLEEVVVWHGCEVLGARLDLLSAMAARGVAVRLHLAHPGGSAGQLATPRAVALSYADALARQVEARGHPAIELHFDDRAGGGPLQPFRAHLYDAVAPPAGASGGAVRLLQVSPGYAQAQAVLQCIHAAMRRGLPLQQIGVVVPRPQDVPQLLAAGEAHGLPLRPHCGRPAATPGSLPALLAALTLRGPTLPKAALCDVWTGLGVELAGVASPLVVAALSRLPGRFVGWPALPELLRAERLPGDSIAALLQALQPCVELPAQAPLEVFLAPLLALLRRRLEAACQGPTTQDEAASLLALQDELLALQQAARQVAASLPAAGRPWNIGEVAGWLQGVLPAALPAAAVAAPLGVALLTPEQALGCRFDALIWAGCPPDAFPRPPRPAGLLSEARRSALQRLLGPRLMQHTGQAPGARDLWLWLEVVAGAGRTLDVVLVRPAEADEADEAPWLEAIRRAAGAPPQSAPTAAQLALQRTPRDAATARSWRWRQEQARRHHLGQAPFAAPLLEGLRQQLAAHPHSTSRLDALGMCAYRYFAAAALGLRAPPEASLGATPQGRGSAAHAALCALYSDPQHLPEHLAKTADPAASLTAAARFVAAHADTILAGIAVHPLLRPALLQAAQDGVRAILQADLAAVPPPQLLALEYAFDQRPQKAAAGAAPALQLTLQAGGAPLTLQVRGSIDRVDRQGDTLRIIDYKSTVKPRGPGRHFQLALYAVVALRDWGASTQQVQAAWQDLGQGKLKPAPELWGTPAAVRATVEATLGDRLEPILRGQLDPDPDPVYGDVCAHCDYAALCRFDAARACRAEALDVG